MPLLEDSSLLGIDTLSFLHNIRISGFLPIYPLIISFLRLTLPDTVLLISTDIPHDSRPR